MSINITLKYKKITVNFKHFISVTLPRPAVVRNTMRGTPPGTILTHGMEPISMLLGVRNFAMIWATFYNLYIFTSHALPKQTSINKL